jgi:hypothetical protein
MKRVDDEFLQRLDVQLTRLRRRGEEVLRSAVRRRQLTGRAEEADTATGPRADSRQADAPVG